MSSFSQYKSRRSWAEGWPYYADGPMSGGGVQEAPGLPVVDDYVDPCGTTYDDLKSTWRERLLEEGRD